MREKINENIDVWMGEKVNIVLDKHEGRIRITLEDGTVITATDYFISKASKNDN